MTQQTLVSLDPENGAWTLVEIEQYARSKKIYCKSSQISLLLDGVYLSRRELARIVEKCAEVAQELITKFYTANLFIYFLVICKIKENLLQVLVKFPFKFF